MPFAWAELLVVVSSLVQWRWPPTDDDDRSVGRTRRGRGEPFSTILLSLFILVKTFSVSPYFE